MTVTGGGRLSPRLSIATGGSACDVTHYITSIIQSFIYKCNNSNSCKLFYLDYKSMLIQKLPQTPYMAFPVDWQVWAQENMFILHSANLFRDEQWTLLGNQILHRRSGIISIHVTHPCLYKCLQVHVIANARQVRFVLVSPNWPNTSETAVNGRCQQEMWQHKPRFLFHRERMQTRS